MPTLDAERARHAALVEAAEAVVAEWDSGVTNYRTATAVALCATLAEESK